MKKSYEKEGRGRGLSDAAFFDPLFLIYRLQYEFPAPIFNQDTPGELPF